ncbi:MAG: septum formation initiator family protein [Ruminococcus sp.]|nr:septum formation initiator family protein [Ruminococcus sp.]
MSRKKRYNSKKGLFNRSLVRLVAAAVFVGCTVLLFATESDCHEKEEQIAVIQTKLDKYEADNDELQRVLESDDKNAYMEKIAREEYHYAYPDEHRFYDKTRN